MNGGFQTGPDSLNRSFTGNFWLEKSAVTEPSVKQNNEDFGESETSKKTDERPALIMFQKINNKICQAGQDERQYKDKKRGGKQTPGRCLNFYSVSDPEVHSI